MAGFIFLTKTRWTESPRIRHQIAKLLAEAGHDVLFFEKPAPFWRAREKPRKVSARITLSTLSELLHHKLRYFPFLHWLNALVVNRSISRAVSLWDKQDAHMVIVNFNYDYCFLRKIFPHSRIVTMINDDFVSHAPFGFTSHLRWALARTCAMSDRVLTVSLPLQTQLEPFAEADLFLPWADRAYLAPEHSSRDLILFWGFINRKIDFHFVNSLALRLQAERPHLKIVFAGPVENDAERHLAGLKIHPNIEIRPATPLDALPLNRVLASLIPYKAGSREIDAIMLPNKALQILARGIPLLISGLPNFIKAPFVFRIDSASGDSVLDEITANFDGLQPAIRDFVGSHTERARLRQFEEAAGMAPH